ncbi:DUF6538 domain-containing protein [uncultured Roseibium sp.]|uniref:DUF6538 domain-containing protein n=1 Tax=uncultured Roseibium sp. TaxID=1936171 RepID=UPI0026215A2F|nr:DUF6538 domain-containing protein [uncultured Roseibium sp.]
MSRPVRHKTTGIYQFRKRVPDDLRQVIGKSEVKVSLKTRDPAEAQIEYFRVAAEIADRWNNLRNGQVSLTKKQAFAIAGEIYRKIVSENEENPEKIPAVSAITRYNAIFNPDKVKIIVAAPSVLEKIGKTPKELIKELVISRSKKSLDDYLGSRGIRLDEDSYKLALECLHEAIFQASEHVFRMAKGDYRPDPEADRFPPWEAPTTKQNKPEDPTKEFGLIAIFDEYSKEYNHSVATRDRWRPILCGVAEVHPDIRTIDQDWCFEWRDRLIAKGLALSTVKDGYLAALKSTCNWAVQKRLIERNPVEGVQVKVRLKKGQSQRGFTTEEANLILPAAVQKFKENLSPEHRDARRWLPWLCAYTGARVGEIAQLRKKDLRQVGDVWLLWITPEAGTQKTISERFVAVHPHLIEQGFIDFVKNKQDGPLFFDPRRARNSKRSNSQSRKVSERVGAWVRSLGIKDKRVWPNHGWRHRFKTVARKVKMDPGTRDYLQGHVPHNEAEEYGEYEPDVLYGEIAKLPRYDVL